MRVLGVDHVSVSCGDLDRSLAFYAGTLGLAVRERGELAGGSAEAITGLAGLRARFADLELGGGRTLELLEFVSPSGPALAPELERPGATHLALHVDDAAAAFRAIGEAGYALVSQAVAEIEDEGFWKGSRAFYCLDPDGVTIELIERPA
jgi:glyoxylase I family protein